MIYTLAKPLVTLLLHVWWHARIIGGSHVPKKGPVILASNHLAIADTWVMPGLMDRPVHFLGKSDLFGKGSVRSRLLAMFLKSVHVMPMSRAGGSASRASLDAGLAVLGRGDVLGIFPEGTRSPDGRLYRGKTGVARLALAVGCPIVPVAMLGTYEAQKGRKFCPRRTPRMTVVVGEPMDPVALADASGATGDGARYRAVTDAVMDAIDAMSGQERADEFAADAKRRLRAAS